MCFYNLVLVYASDDQFLFESHNLSVESERDGSLPPALTVKLSQRKLIWSLRSGKLMKDHEELLQIDFCSAFTITAQLPGGAGFSSSRLKLRHSSADDHINTEVTNKTTQVLMSEDFLSCCLWWRVLFSWQVFKGCRILILELPGWKTVAMSHSSSWPEVLLNIRLIKSRNCARWEPSDVGTYHRSWVSGKKKPNNICQLFNCT